MKFIITLLFASLLFGSSVGQKSYIEKNEIDEFTGKRIVLTKSTYVYELQSLMFWDRAKVFLLYNSGNYFLGFMMNYRNQKYFVPMGSNFYFKLKNEKVIKLTNLESAFSTEGGGVTVAVNQKLIGVTLNSIISKEDIISLSESPIVKMRIETSKGYYEVEINDLKHAEKFLDAAKEFLAAVPD